MQMLLSLGVHIPEDVRILGMDDMKCARLLPVPLTTIHQDCIGAVAMATMMQRVENPRPPVRDVLIPFHVVVRRSCGAHLARPALEKRLD